MVEAVVKREETAGLQKSQKKSFINRLKMGKKSKKSVDSREDDTPMTREGVPVISSMSGNQHFNPSDVQNANKVSKGRNSTKTVVLAAAPSAKIAAFEGPPRYDWIDVETAAAIKVQSVFRRNKVMDELEAEGVNTTAMRNRRRKRRALLRSRFQSTEDTPGIFSCCGAGLIFGDATEDDQNAQREFEKQRYEEQKRKQYEEEERLRHYVATHGKTHTSIRESIEVQA